MTPSRLILQIAEQVLREISDPKRAGVAGNRVVSASAGGNLENAVSRAVNQPVKINVRSRANVMVSPPGQAWREEFIRKQMGKQPQGPGEPDRRQPRGRP
jgi:hypothetical protein